MLELREVKKSYRQPDGGLLPILEKRRGGESGVNRIRFVEGGELWRAANQGLWSQPLLAAARSLLLPRNSARG